MNTTNLVLNSQGHRLGVLKIDFLVFNKETILPKFTVLETRSAQRVQLHTKQLAHNSLLLKVTDQMGLLDPKNTTFTIKMELQNSEFHQSIQNSSISAWFNLAPELKQVQIIPEVFSINGDKKLVIKISDLYDKDDSFEKLKFSVWMFYNSGVYLQ
jgi:hypothetical protein